jgi:hypothetical protein
MIRCTLELVRASNGEIKHLGTIEISNQVMLSSLNPRRGDYRYRVFKKRWVPWRDGVVKNFPRLSYHPWNLIREILNEVATNNGGRI